MFIMKEYVTAGKQMSVDVTDTVPLKLFHSQPAKIAKC